ncbi:MAG: hypothetical protein ABIR30_06190 [Chitinophagaceae bacterium]
MKKIFLPTGILTVSLALTMASHAQDNRATKDTAATIADTTKKNIGAPSAVVTTDSLKTKKSVKKKKKHQDNGENPYQVSTPPAKPLPYNSPKDKPKTPEETPLGGILKDIITEKKKQ